LFDRLYLSCILYRSAAAGVPLNKEKLGLSCGNYIYTGGRLVLISDKLYR
jgi:hypothetical protein